MDLGKSDVGIIEVNYQDSSRFRLGYSLPHSVKRYLQITSLHEFTSLVVRNVDFEKVFQQEQSQSLTPKFVVTLSRLLQILIIVSLRWGYPKKSSK